MADEASTAGQVVTERGIAEPPPPATLVCKRDEDAHTHGEIGGEAGHCYRVMPREAYRLAYGWMPGEASARFTVCAAELGTDPPDALASLAANGNVGAMGLTATGVPGAAYGRRA